MRFYGPPASLQATKDEAATLMWLYGKGLPVPFIAGYDFSRDNVLGVPHVLECTVSGEGAKQVSGKLSLDGRVQVVDTMANMATQMRDITFSQSGHLVAAKDPSDWVADNKSKFWALVSN